MSNQPTALPSTRPPVPRERLAGACEAVARDLRRELDASGHWCGELSSSALSTATAVTALATVDRERHATLIRGGLEWLAAHANADGGWGDTVCSRSNLSTTALVWGAFGAARAGSDFQKPQVDAVGYLNRAAGSLGRLVPAIEACYGKDRTFSVPITMMLALSGRLGPDGWHKVRPLPFELAALPRGLFGALRLPVVSYALPALIAIGQVIQHHAPRFNPLRAATRRRTLDVLTSLQPENGGFLEATPLTSFVTMSLASMGLQQHVVARRGAEFLVQSVRRDGSWPIDTNLATWVTTLSIKALSQTPGGLDGLELAGLRDWLVGQQYRGVHPYTGAAPGGWAWTDLPGGVPDADDTAGALLALAHLDSAKHRHPGAAREAAAAGAHWLLGLQNGDGGIPTFCRGWGTLPFDRSTPELTAHALRAWRAWVNHFPEALARRLAVAVRRATNYLLRTQRADGAWIPLWFGNESATGQENPVYGTAQVVIGLAGEPASPEIDSLLRKARGFLRSQQNPDGGWGGESGTASTIEESSLALEALAGDDESADGVQRGLQWLVEAVEGGRHRKAAPIGLYFARLWYYERLYPLIFATSALGRHSRSR